MAGDPLSFVYNGRDNTGAATILKQPTVAPAPKPDTRFLDSLGFDIRDGGNVWEYGKENVIKAKNEYLKAYTQALVEGVDLKKDPQRGMTIIQQKQAANDTVSKEQRDEKTAIPIDRDLIKNPELYTPESKPNFEAWKRNPNRPPQPEGVVRYTKADFSDANKPTKGYYKVVKKVTTDEKGASVTRQVPEFLEENARKDFQIDYRQSQGNYKLEGLKKLTYEDLSNRVPNWDQIPLADRGLMVEKVLEDDFIQKAKANIPTTIIGNKEAPEDKTANTSTKGGYDIDKDIALSWELTGNDNMVKRVDFNLTPIPNPKKKIAEDGALDWNDANKRVVRSPLVQVRVRENGKPFVVVKEKKEIKDKYGVVIETKEQEVELPLTTNNKNNLRDYYNFDADKEITSPDAKWRSKLDKFTDPKAADFGNLSQERFDIILGKRNAGKKATPAKTTTTTKIDPVDEEFFVRDKVKK